MKKRIYLLSLIVPALFGCGQSTPKVDAKTDINARLNADKQFLDQINALPQNQRSAFIHGHYPQFRALMSDPDPTVHAAFTELLKQNPS